MSGVTLRTGRVLLKWLGMAGTCVTSLHSARTRLALPRLSCDSRCHSAFIGNEDHASTEYQSRLSAVWRWQHHVLPGSRAHVFRSPVAMRCLARP